MELEQFKYTVLPLREKLQHIAMKVMEMPVEAEDVVQETFLKLWNIREKLDEYNSVEALAVTITKNTALDYLKKSKPQSPEQEVINNLASKANDPAEQLKQADVVNCVRHLIAQLPSLQQITIRMKDIEGYELHEIAEITGCQIEAVRTNLSRARKKIREQYLALNKERQWI